MKLADRYSIFAVIINLYQLVILSLAYCTGRVTITGLALELFFSTVMGIRTFDNYS